MHTTVSVFSLTQARYFYPIKIIHTILMYLHVISKLIWFFFSCYKSIEIPMLLQKYLGKRSEYNIIKH